MAKKTVTTTEYTDDLDGGKAEGTIHFGFDGISYEIDLSKANARAFEKAMAVYVGHARKVRPARTKAAAAVKPKHDLAAIREWAKNAGYEVSDRGRIAAAVVEAYEAAN
jgi:hypothetical protein